MKVYVVVGEQECFGVFLKKESAEQRKDAVYDNGFCGCIAVVEDQLEEE